MYIATDLLSSVWRLKTEVWLLDSMSSADLFQIYSH